jgi:hypothetical protein
MAMAGSLKSPQFLPSGQPATAGVCQSMAENEPSRIHMPGILMNTPAGQGLIHHHHHHQITKLSHSINAIGPAPHRSGRKREQKGLIHVSA